MRSLNLIKMLGVRWRELLLGAGSSALLFGCATSYPAGSNPAFRSGSENLSSLSDSRYGHSSTPVVESRPGLGTEYGEQRQSGVTAGSFTRASSTPSGRASIYYNDRAGINAVKAGGAYAKRTRSFTVGDGVSVEIRGGRAWGGAFPGYSIGGRDYVVGDSGERYTIKIRNKSYRRVEVVLSVDGLDVMDGRAASTSKRGYIVPARSSRTVEGWRTSMSSVAAFRFGSVSDSYSARSGAGTRNVGVIGVAVFAEKVYTYPPYRHGGEVNRRHAADPFPSDPRFAQPPRG